MLWKKRKKRTGEAARRAAAVLGKGQFRLKNMAVMAAVTVCGAAALRAHRSWMEEKAAQQELAASVIRFHVLADSDRQRDQQVKLEVRDALLERMEKLLEGAESLETARKRLGDNLESLREEAETVVREAGSSVPVNVELTREDFPVRTYSRYRFPAGEYETLQITLGSGEGHNWWCLIFPSLCFQDSLHPVLSEDGERKLKYVLSDETYDRILQKEKVSIGFLWF